MDWHIFESYNLYFKDLFEALTLILKSVWCVSSKTRLCKLVFNLDRWALANVLDHGSFYPKSVTLISYDKDMLSLSFATFKHGSLFTRWKHAFNRPFRTLGAI